MEIIIEEPTYSFVGGNLSIDFTNTVNSRWSGEVRDKFSGYRDLVAWSRQADIIREEEVLRLLEEAERNPNAAKEALAEAIELREVIYRLFEAVALERTPSGADTKLFNKKLAEAMNHARIEPLSEGFAWVWEESDALDRMMWPISRSAADLLTSHELERVRTCGANDCGWLFLDTSRNGSRRWCDMSDCGNRAKARRHYNRVKKGQIE
jgi:predicted RNA-binding Zn ribbon-like protein